VFRNARLPDSGTIDYTPSVVLEMATNAIHDWGGHLISTARDGRLVTTVLRDLANEAVNEAGNMFTMPPMAVAESIEGVSWIPQLDQPGKAIRLQLIPANMEAIFYNSDTRGTPSSYAIKDNVICVYPRPEERGYLQVSYMRRHGQLVVGSDTASVVAVLSTGFDDQLELQVTSNPTSYTVGAWIDVYGQYYPYRLKASGRIAGGAPGTLTIWGNYEDWAASVAPGDTTVILGKTPYVHLPLEMRSAQHEQIASKLTAVMGDFQLSPGYNNMAKESEARARDMLTPRSKGDKQKLVNPYSLARGGRSGGRRRWGGW
jgi:hypothetical protein